MSFSKCSLSENVNIGPSLSFIYVCLKARIRDRRKNRFYICWFTPLMAATTRAGPDQSKKTRTPSRFPTYGTGTYISELSSAASPGALAGLQSVQHHSSSATFCSTILAHFAFFSPKNIYFFASLFLHAHSFILSSPWPN